jgi:hypothetical protein
MTTRTVDRRTLWAVLLMEAGIVLPLVSIPAQGDGIRGLPGPLLLMLLLPLGFVAVKLFPVLRDPSWRLPIGIGVALLARVVVSSYPGPEFSDLALWLTHNLIPVALGVALWWRGGALTVSELTPSDVRTEFALLGAAMLMMLALVRPFVLADQVLLGAAVALFIIGGLLAVVSARQDAAELNSASSARALGAMTAIAPVGVAVVLVGLLQPSLLAAMWTTLERVLELLLTPLAMFFAWLASLLPRGGPAQPPPPPPQPPPSLTPDPAMLDQMNDQSQWLGLLVLLLLVLLVGLALMLLVRLMLSHWLRPPEPREEREGPEVEAESAGNARRDVRALLGWLLRWLRTQLGLGRGAGRGGGRHGASAGRHAQGELVDAWAAYQRLLEWASQQGLGRRPTETTGQLQSRLNRQVPMAAESVDLVTVTYEQERYGTIHPPRDRLQRLRAALTRLTTPTPRPR